MERRRLIIEFTTVAIISAVLVFTVMNWVSQQKPSPGDGIIVIAITATGTYFIIFKVLLWLYFRHIWVLINAKVYVGGNWHYFYNDSYNQEQQRVTKPDRQGEARIEHTPEGIYFYGESRDPNSDYPSSAIKTVWESSSSAISGDRIDFSINFVNEAGAGFGFARIHVVTRLPILGIIPKRPTVMKGFYVFLLAQGELPRWGRMKFVKTSELSNTRGVYQDGGEEGREENEDS